MKCQQSCAAQQELLKLVTTIQLQDQSACGITVIKHREHAENGSVRFLACDGPHICAVWKKRIKPRKGKLQELSYNAAVELGLADVVAPCVYTEIGFFESFQTLRHHAGLDVTSPHWKASTTDVVSALLESRHGACDLLRLLQHSPELQMVGWRDHYPYSEDSADSANKESSEPLSLFQDKGCTAEDVQHVLTRLHTQSVEKLLLHTAVLGNGDLTPSNVMLQVIDEQGTYRFKVVGIDTTNCHIDGTGVDDPVWVCGDGNDPMDNSSHDDGPPTKEYWLPCLLFLPSSSMPMSDEATLQIRKWDTDAVRLLLDSHGVSTAGISRVICRIDAIQAELRQSAGRCSLRQVVFAAQPHWQRDFERVMDSVDRLAHDWKVNGLQAAKEIHGEISMGDLTIALLLNTEGRVGF